MTMVADMDLESCLYGRCMCCPATSLLPFLNLARRFAFAGIGIERGPEGVGKKGVREDDV